VVETPDSTKREEELAAVLQTRADESAGVEEELREIAERLERAMVEFGDIEQVAEGDGNAQNAAVVNSNIEINQGTSRGPGS
jgi:hypothetical protein